MFLPALAMVSSSGAVDSFLILDDNMPNHDKMPELLSYFDDQDMVQITAQSSFTLKQGITMKWGHGPLQEQQTQSKVGILVCKCFFNATIQPSNIVDFSIGLGDQRIRLDMSQPCPNQSSNAMCSISTSNCWCTTSRFHSKAI